MVNVNVKRFSKSKVIDEPVMQSAHEPEPEHEPTRIIDDNEFLNDLHKDTYEQNIKEEEQKIENEKNYEKNKKEEIKLNKERDKENMKLIKEMEKQNKKVNKKIIDDDVASILSEEGTQLLGKNKHILLKKVKQFKELFPDELKKFKIKFNASEEQLQNYLDEMDIITSISNVDQFLLDGIFQSIKVIEGISSRTKNYNISGLADLLKSNTQFHNITKRLFIKYNCYNNMPDEYQLLFIVSTSCYICRNKNMKREELSNYLNEEIKINN